MIGLSRTRNSKPWAGFGTCIIDYLAGFARTILEANALDYADGLKFHALDNVRH